MWELAVAVAVLLGSIGDPQPEASPSKTPDAAETDWAAVRDARRAKRVAQGAVRKATFVARFVEDVPQSASTATIQVGSYDQRFVLTVEVVRVVDGELPDPDASHLQLEIHSPSILFRLQGIETPEGRSLPTGKHRLTLFELRNGVHELEIEPLP